MSGKYTWSWDAVAGCCTVYRVGEQVLRTLLPWDEKERHEKLAKIICESLERAEGNGTQQRGGSKPTSGGDISWYYDIIDRGLKPDSNCNTWERTFLTEWKEKFRKYGSYAKISDRVIDVFKKIDDVIVNGRPKR